MKLLNFVCAATLIALTTCSSEPTIGKVSKSEFKKLKEGMTYEEAIKIIGGKERSKNDMSENLLMEYDFDGEESGLVSLLFKDGKLDTIIGMGLMEKEKLLTEEQKSRIKRILKTLKL